MSKEVQPFLAAFQLTKIKIPYLGDHLSLVTVLLTDSVQHQLGVDTLLGLLPPVLQHQGQAGHVVIAAVHILDRDICPHLGEWLQQLSEGQVVLTGYQFCVLIKIQISFDIPCVPKNVHIKVRPKFRVASTSKFIFYFKKPDFSIQTSQDSIWYYQKCVPKVLVT